jgi:hypothetical protein
MHKKYYFIGLILCSGIIIYLSNYYYGTYNPFDVFDSGLELYIKVIVGLFVLLFVVLLFYFLMSLSSYDVKSCPICNKNLTRHTKVHGKAKVCWKCYQSGRVTQFHETCFQSVGKCPVCGATSPGDRNSGDSFYYNT